MSAMHSTPLSATLTVLALCVLGRFSNAQILHPNLPTAQQLVVLNNGEVIEGRITRTSEHAVVETSQGSRLMLAADRVDFICDSMQDAYWGKCARTKATDFAGQKALFYWCMKHNLYEQAENQISLMTESDKFSAADIEYLDRQLTIAISKISQLRRHELAESPIQWPHAPAVGFRSDQPQQLESQATQLKNQPNNHSNWILKPLELDDSLGSGELANREVEVETFTPLPVMNFDSEQTSSAMLEPMTTQMATLPSMPESSVRQVDFEEPIFEPKNENKSPTIYKTISPDHRVLSPEIPPKPSATPRNITNAELDQMTRSMPQGTLGPYRTKLERIMTNSCAAANCHDSKSATMPLLHFGRTQPITRRMSQRNLHETLKFLDRSDPFSSPLLTAASEPHAGGDTPILPEGSKHFEQLKLWLVMLSDDPEGNFKAYQNRNQPGSLQPLQALGVHPLPHNISSENPEQPIVPIKPDPIGFQPLDESLIEIPTTIGEIPDLNSQRGIYKPVDPFDPEIFNRQFGGK
ncbi:MAG: hypothetical protein P8J27_04200 [Mariniblastus sp.]|nr:hypothetical protein [Mariniblastus sp.]